MIRQAQMIVMSDGQSYHHGDLRVAALAAARAVLAADGAEAVTMRSVAKRVGVTHRALYRWYPEREALLAALAAEGFSGLAASVRTAVAGARTGAIRSAFVSAFVKFALAEPELYALAMAQNRAALKQYPALGSASADMVAASIEAFGDASEDPRDFVIALWSLLHGLIDLYRAGLLAIRGDDRLIDYALTLAERVAHDREGNR